jgi:hypothetical protein
MGNTVKETVLLARLTAVLAGHGRTARVSGIDTRKEMESWT